ncbi:3-dehydroquinate dehydratase [Pseudohyphozyma bogoriensis]|nr:3-dehydroquinate dehydratase [Pseudohyphozyma bogoriensis]
MPTQRTTDAAGVTRISKPDPAEGDRSLPRDTKTFLLLSGVNHNLFGSRDPKAYGSDTLAMIEERVTKFGKELGVNVVCFQTNYEGEMCEAIHYARGLGGVVMNPGAFAHYSYALHDAIDACDSPVVEVHISNVYAREEFRHNYELGLRTAIQRVAEQAAAGKA